MAEIYAFGPGWDLPETVQDNVKTLVDQHLAGNPSGDALVNQKLTALESGKADKVHTHTTAQVAGLDGQLSQINVAVGSAGAVKSVNGQTGAVVVDSTNVLSVDGYVRNRGALPDGADLNAYRTVTDVGVWGITAGRTYYNCPLASTESGFLVVHQNVTSATQKVVRYGAPGTWERSSSSLNAWNAWAGIAVSEIPSGSNIDEMRSSHEWAIRNATVATSLAGTWPAGVPRVPASLSIRSINTGIVFQQLQTYGADPKLLFRSTSAVSPTPYPFSEWRDTMALDETRVRALVAEASPSLVAPHAGLANSILLQDFTRRRPVVKTGGKPALALRFDHGLKNFSSLIVPHLKRLNLKAALCLNGGAWGHVENTGVTAADVNTWVTEGWLEIWNHSLDHVAPPADPAALETQIKGGLEKLRADLPAAVIDGYMAPGGGTDLTGFDSGRTLESWWASSTGRMILQHHAVGQGYLPGTGYRPLDGQPRQGQGYFITDATTAAGVKSIIQGAYNPARGVQLMLHPSVVGGTDKITAADVTEVLEWIAAERDAGRLVVLGSYDLLRADAGA